MASNPTSNSTTSNDAVQEEEVIEIPRQWSLSDFLYEVEGNLIKTYIFYGFANPQDAQENDLIDSINSINPEEFSEQTYYVLGYFTKTEGNTSTTTTPKNTTYSSYSYGTVVRPTIKNEVRLFKVTRTNVFSSVEEYVDVNSDKSIIQSFFPKVSPATFYSLPKIPYNLHQEILDFLVTVDKKLGTEAIVLLTYDFVTEGLEDSQRWGYIIPPQKNTAASCDYEHQAAVADLPENLTVVGSIHSHPGMAAYASGVDHTDQAAFDGIHITYGWPKGKAFEFYAELSIGENNYVIDVENVIETKPQNISGKDFSNVIGTLVNKSTYGYTKTSKKTGTPQNGTLQNYKYNYGTDSFKANAKILSVTSSFDKWRKVLKDKKKYGKVSQAIKNDKYSKLGSVVIHYPDISRSEVFLKDAHAKPTCACCGYDILFSEIVAQQCFSCNVPFTYGTQTIQDLINYCCDKGIVNTFMSYVAEEESFGHKANVLVVTCDSKVPKTKKTYEAQTFEVSLD